MDIKFYSLFGLGVLAGSMLAMQSVLNATMGKKVGILGSLVVMTVIGLSMTLVFIALFPSSSNLRALPGKREWYLYLGAVMGFVIMLIPIFLVPRIGATSTLTALVMGQLTLALIVDHYGLLSTPQISINLARLLGVALLILGAYLISR